MSEFKGTKGLVNSYSSDNNSMDIVLPNDTTISIDRQSRYTNEYTATREEMEANGKLIIDAFNVRNQIEFDLPELLKQRNEMFELLNEILELARIGIIIDPYRVKEVIKKQSNYD